MEPDCDALSVRATADHGKPERVRRGGQQLVVLAEAEVVDGRAGRERNVLEVELDPAAGSGGEMAGVDRQAVRDIRERMGDLGETTALLEAERRARMALLAERGARCAERPGHDDEVSASRARSARHALRAP